jgi:hypothetical protein
MQSLSTKMNHQWGNLKSRTIVSRGAPRRLRLALLVVRRGAIRGVG